MTTYSFETEYPTNDLAVFAAVDGVDLRIAWMSELVLVIQGLIFVFCVMLFRRGIVGEPAQRFRWSF